jgi:hypothetical protein
MRIESYVGPDRFTHSQPGRQEDRHVEI